MNRFCPSCGQKIVEEGAFCINCGYNLSKQNEEQEKTYNNNYSQASNNLNTTSVTNYNNGMAIAGFVLGIISLLCCCYTSWISIAGLIFSVVGLSNANSHCGSGKGLAIAGIVLNSISILLTIIYSIIFLGTYML
ncbi:MAG: DUF4190 domain-containing protein [Mycoplasmatota bacterium]|nr:DUF4190 domain-containing protein [Mycoplasmatota bacterium]